MKQTDIYTKALICLRSILQTDHPEFKNWIGWLERDIQDWTQRREVSHHLRAYGEMCIRDRYYPVYFGYDAKGEVCGVYVRFIDIEASYREQD